MSLQSAKTLTLCLFKRFTTGHLTGGFFVSETYLFSKGILLRDLCVQVGGNSK